jgi:hypothetical protein
MKLKGFQYILSIFLTLSLLSVSGCFTTLQTAKTTDGASFTTGIQRYHVKEEKFHPAYEKHYKSYHLLVLMARFGRMATRHKVGWDFGLKFLTDKIDHGDYDPVGFFSEEFKVQFPRKLPFDLALAAELWLYYPGSFSILFSKDLSPKFTLYSELKFMGALYDLSERDEIFALRPKVTLGTEINLIRNFSFLFEVERIFHHYDDSKLATSLNAGVCLKLPYRE